MIEIKDKSNCCGCAACVQRCPKQCISLKEDKEGFLYPIVDKNTCIDCGLCEKVCPVIHQNEPSKPLKVYAAKNKNEDIRFQSSSGGVFTLFAEQVINRGGVVFGACFDEKWEVKHDFTETIEGLSAFRGSKYLQSRIEDTFAKAEYFLKQGREVLFSGTPCQIIGLKRFLRKEYENLLLLDIVCHGVPSPLVWREYLKGLSRKQDIRAVNFRNKTDGWKTYKVVVKGQKNEIVREPFFQNIFMQGFLRDIYLRPSCYACPAKAGRSGADITLGDFWGVENHMPEFDDDKGVSLAMLQSHKGVTHFGMIESVHLESDYAKALAGNPAIEHSVDCNPKYRRLFWKSEDKINSISWVISKMKPSFAHRCLGYIKRKIRKLII